MSEQAAKSLEIDERLSEAIRETEIANRSERTREFQKQEQTARKRLEDFDRD